MGEMSSGGIIDIPSGSIATSSQAVVPEIPTTQSSTTQMPPPQTSTAQMPVQQTSTAQMPMKQTSTAQMPVQQSSTANAPASSITPPAWLNQVNASQAHASQAYASEANASQAYASEAIASQAYALEANASQANTTPNENPGSQSSFLNYRLASTIARMYERIRRSANNTSGPRDISGQDYVSKSKAAEKQIDTLSTTLTTTLDSLNTTVAALTESVATIRSNYGRGAAVTDPSAEGASAENAPLENVFEGGRRRRTKKYRKKALKRARYSRRK